MSVEPTEQAEAARHAYTTMGLRALRHRERSRVVTEPEEGHRIWRTPEYNVMSGWALVPHRDVAVQGTWSALTTAQREALIHTTMQTHGYSAAKARLHFAGADTEDESMVLLIAHDLAAPPQIGRAHV